MLSLFSRFQGIFQKGHSGLTDSPGVSTAPVEQAEEAVKPKKVRSSRWALVVALIILLLMLLALVVMVFFMRERTTLFGRAFGPPIEPGEVVLENSYIFASPLSARADGREKIRVTVFILDAQGRGVYGQPVSLGRSEKLEVDLIQETTDNLGRAIFDLSSVTAADYYIEAKVDNRTLPLNVRVGFR